MNLVRNVMANIAISQFSCCTPHFASLNALFNAWLDGDSYAPPYATYPDETQLFSQLVHGAVAPVLATLKSPADCGLILATAKGDLGWLETWLDQAGEGRPPGHFASSPPLITDCAHAIARQYGLGGPILAVSTACTSGLSGLMEAALMVESGAERRMIVLAVDIAGEFIVDGFRALKALCARRSRPFDLQRDGLALGSAAVACLVHQTDMHAGAPKSREGITTVPAFAPDCYLVGWGGATDAVHLTAPDREAGGLIRAVEMALRKASLAPDEIDGIFLHGTGTLYNDAMEVCAVKKLFPNNPPLTAVKGLVGHTLGASGLLEAALASLMLRHDVLPAVTGLREPQWPDLHFVSQMRRGTKLRRILKTSSGFGGINGAVILEAIRSGVAGGGNDHAG